jgi:hypothetical protein
MPNGNSRLQYAVTLSAISVISEFPPSNLLVLSHQRLCCPVECFRRVLMKTACLYSWMRKVSSALCTRRLPL